MSLLTPREAIVINYVSRFARFLERTGVGYPLVQQARRIRDAVVNWFWYIDTQGNMGFRYGEEPPSKNGQQKGE